MLLKAISCCTDGKDAIIYVPSHQIWKRTLNKAEDLLKKIPEVGWKVQDDKILIGASKISHATLTNGSSRVFFDESIND